MAFSINNIAASYQSTMAAPKNGPRNKAVTGMAPDYDAITINASPQKAEAQFAQELTKAISSQVNRPAPAERIEELSRQIKDDTYVISPQEIAAKLLLTDGGKIHDGI